MSTTAFERFWQLLGGVFALNPEALQTLSTLPQSLILALIVVAAAGLSQAIAQSIILFINQVKPIRFIFSLLLNAVLFIFGCAFLVISTWLATFLPWIDVIPFPVLVTVLGISYAPLIFSFLGAIPYLGGPMLTLLSIWHLFAMIVGIKAVTGFETSRAFECVAIGWLVLRLLENTVGQPLANLGRWIANIIAGVQLITRSTELQDIIQGNPASASLTTPPPTPTAQVTVPPSRSTDRPHPPSPSQPPQETTITFTTDPASIRAAVLKLRTMRRPPQGVDRTIRTLLGLLGMALLAFLVVVTFDPIREWLAHWVDQFPEVIQLIFDLVWIGIIALIVTGLLAPLETLGWWAGWYADEVDTILNAGTLATPIEDETAISHYAVYLDGISKSSFEYLPDVEDFLSALVPVLPENMALIRGIMPYSVLNNPLNEDRPLAVLWRLADRLRLGNPASLLGLLINLRNVWVVAVSADRRYGPLYNQGIAQVIHNGLINNGYQPNSGTPVTLIGFSGGGQMAAACAPFLKRALSAPIDVISLGGVISGNCNVLKLEHLYHLVGQKDTVERLGVVMFPGRWKIFPLSYWNRAKQRGKISRISLGPVGHQLPGGLMDPHCYLPDGRSFLQQTIDRISEILRDELPSEQGTAVVKPSNYDLYLQAAFNHPDYYPVQQSPPADRYHPIAPWMGRLILPKPQERKQVRGALFQVYHAPPDYNHLVGQTVPLRWSFAPQVQSMVRAVTKDVHFSAEAEYTSKYGRLVHPDRINHWRQVDPLESLAGARPIDDVIVMLPNSIEVEEHQNLPAKRSSGSNTPCVLRIASQPIQITGRYYGLVTFVPPTTLAAPDAQTDRFRVIHFNQTSRQFDGPEEIVRVPRVIADQNGLFPSSRRSFAASPLNETGWYIYGAQDAEGLFVVQSIAPRSLLRLQPDQVIFGAKAAYRYIRKQAWDKAKTQKGQISSVLLSAMREGQETEDKKQQTLTPHTPLPTPLSPIQTAIDHWQPGDRALVLHVYGGIGGKKREPAAQTPLFFGHFAYGVATVVRDPIADELRFEIQYFQVYTHNTDGIVAGTLHWNRFMGDRQFGWLGSRPTADILIKLDAFTGDYSFGSTRQSPLDNMIHQLEAMTARYRIGDGTGGTYVGAANNCSQDSNRALFASILNLETNVRNGLDLLEQWAAEHPRQAQKFQRLVQLERSLKRQLQPFGIPREDWEHNEYNLGSTLEDEPLRNLLTGLSSWRTLLPRLASDAVVKSFLRQGATVWVLRTNQVGADPEIEPIAPMTL